MNEVLRRKIDGTSSPPKTTGITLESLLRKTMPRDADAALSLDVDVKSFVSSSASNSDLRSEISPFHLVFLLENERNERGLVILDAGLLSAIIEVQVAGELLDTQMADRKPTRTDGMVAGEIVDRWLESAGAAAREAGLEDVWPCAGFSRAPAAINLREAELLLEPVEFRTIDVTFRLGATSRTGQLRLALPQTRPPQGSSGASNNARMRLQLPELPVNLRAVLTRLPMSLAQANDLAEDVLLPMPAGCLSHVRLETKAGKLVQLVHLGQSDGQKAVRFGSDRTRPEAGDGAMVDATKRVEADPEANRLPPPDGPADESLGIPALEKAAAHEPEQAGLAEPAPPDGAVELPELPDLP